MTNTNSFIRQASRNTMGGLIDPRLLADSKKTEQSILELLVVGFKKISGMLALRDAEQA